MTSPITFRVTTHGAPVFNVGWVVRRSRHMIAFELDMDSKYTSVAASAGHELFIGANERSLHLAPDVSREAFTVLRVEGMPKDLEFFAASCGRYTLSVCYVRCTSSLERLVERIEDAIWRAKNRFNWRSHDQDQNQ